jgi:ATP-dependent DNA helicase RecQ
LPFVPALHQGRETQPQKEMRCSALQLRNVLRAFQVREAPVLARPAAAAAGLTAVFQRLAWQMGATLGNGPTLPPVPVLLVDDMVDSGWTLTLAAVLLQHHGSGPVYPFALAKASPRGS